MAIRILQPTFAAIFLFLFFTFSTSAQTPQAAYSRIRTFDVQHYVIRVSFDRSSKTVFGDTTVRLKPLKSGFRTIELDQRNLRFQSVTLDPENKNLEYKTIGEKIFITLDKSYSPEDSVSVRFKYSTVKPKKGIYFIDAKTEDGEIVRDAQIWTQGEPEEARFWFPSYDFPDDKATSEEFITAEKGETIVGNGELVETIENPDGTKTAHYKMPVAHSTYLTSFVIGKYAKYSQSYKNIPLDFYVYSNKHTPLGFITLPDKSVVPSAFVNTANMMKVYEELTGIDFPYNKYDQTIVADFEFGGMENITATTMSDKEIFLADAGFARELVVDLVSHELAHSWFGNLATCKNWSELWLNEGFATYMEAAYREKANGRQDYIRKILADVKAYKASDAVSRNRHGLFFPAARPDESLFDANNASITYLKGGAVIHTLRETVGTENFWRAINVYLNRHKFQNVETKDLQAAMEETSKMNLEWFFSQWVYGAGYPKLEIKQIYNPKTKTLNLTVTQTQKTGGKAAEPFRLPANLEITTPSGTISKAIEIKKSVETFEFKIDEKPGQVVFDREEKIPLKTVKYL